MIATLISNVVTLLSSHSYFEGTGDQKAIAVLSENKKDVLAAIRETIGKLGALVIVGVGRLGVDAPNVPGPEFSSITLLATVHENVTLNRGATGTGEPALSIALAAARLLHHSRPGGILLRVESIDAVEDSATLAYQIRCTCTAALDPAQAPVRTS